MIALVLVAGLAFEAEVERLGHPEAAHRHVARVALVRAGDRAVPALQHGLAAHDPEVRRECARILDRLALASLEGQKRNEAYVIPANKKTANVEQWRRRRIPVQMLLQPKLLKHYDRYYRGTLERWRNPTLADYNRLLLDLADWLAKFGSAGGVDRFEALLAARAIAWKLGTVEPGLGGAGDWTTRWLVRRRLLPAINSAFGRSNGTMTQPEADLFAQVSGHARPLCDRQGRKLLERVHRRLSPQ